MWFERWVLTLPLRLRSLLRRKDVESELQEELNYHVERRTEQEIARGAEPAEARRRALAAFGGLARHADDCRDARRVALLEQIAQDVRYGARLLRKDAAYSAIVIGTLALGIGASTAVFSVVDGVMLRPVPFEAIDRLVMVWGTDRASGTVREPISVPDYLDFVAADTELSGTAAFHGADVTVAAPGAAPTRLPAVAVTSEFLSLLGVRPLLGRAFVAGEDRPGGAATVLIGESLWERQFGRDPAVVGRTLLVNDVAYRVEGVVPRAADFGLLQVLSAAAYARGFADRGDRTHVELWLPLRLDPAAMPRYMHPIFMIGRLDDAASVARAQLALGTVAADLELRHAVNLRRGVNVEPLARVVFAPVRQTLLVLLGAVGFMLLVCCANVANLALARGTARAREIAVRGALGATRARIVRQFLVEHALLALAATGAGVAVAVGGLELLRSFAPANAPRIDEVGVDLRVLAFTAVLSLIVAILFGLIPTAQARRQDVQGIMRREGGGSPSREVRRLRSLLVVSEVALAVVLLLGAGLLMRSFWNVQRTDPGFVAEGILKAEFQLPGPRYPIDEWPRLTRIHHFNDRLIERTSALPGVESVAIARNHPLDAGSRNSFTIIGREEESRSMPELSIRSVSPGYFHTLGLRIVAGRGISETDATDGAAVMTINAAAARTLFPAGDALGQRIALWGARREIVGVVSDERFHGLTQDAPPAAYVPLAQVPPRDGNETLLLRSRGSLAPLADSIRAVFRELDPALATFGVEPLTQTVARSISQRRFAATLLGGFAAIAVVLALVGIHALMSYAVAQRRREFGIRMALGAERRAIVRAVLGEGMRLAVGGLVVGLLLAIAMSRLLAGMLHGVSLGDPVTLGTTIAALCLATLLICALPARQAGRTDPCRAVRET